MVRTLYFLLEPLYPRTSKYIQIPGFPCQWDLDTLWYFNLWRLPQCRRTDIHISQGTAKPPLFFCHLVKPLRDALDLQLSKRGIQLERVISQIVKRVLHPDNFIVYFPDSILCPFRKQINRPRCFTDCSLFRRYNFQLVDQDIHPMMDILWNLYLWLLCYHCFHWHLDSFWYLNLWQLCYHCFHWHLDSFWYFDLWRLCHHCFHWHLDSFWYLNLWRLRYHCFHWHLDTLRNLDLRLLRYHCFHWHLDTFWYFDLWRLCYHSFHWHLDSFQNWH